MSTTNIDDPAKVRVRARYWMLLLLMATAGTAPWVLGVLLPGGPDATDVQALTGGQLVGLLAMPLGLVLWLVAIGDRLRLARAVRLRPNSRRVKEARTATRINLVVATILPLTIAAGIVVGYLPDSVRQQITDAVRTVVPGTQQGGDAPAVNRPAENVPG